MEILILYANKLKEKDFIAYMLFVKEAIEKHPYIGQTYPKYVERILSAYAHMNSIYLKYDYQFHTEQVQKLDEQRTIDFRMLSDAIRFISLYDDDAEKKETASMLLKIIRLYVGTDGISNMKMSEKTAVIVNLVEDFEDKYPQQVETVGVTALVARLKQAQQQFDEVYMLRVVDKSEVGTGAMADARQKMYETYRDLVTVINIDVPYDTEGRLIPFNKVLNVEIMRLRTLTGQGSGTVNKPDGGELEEPKEVTLTFEKTDESVISITGLPGETYEVPEAQAGHIWVKKTGEMEVPNGVFPAESTTYKEVPLGDRSKVVFHFLNGNHEIISALPGTPFEVPETSGENYVWSPTPDGIMPEEETQYFEVAIPGEEEEEEEEDERPKYKITFRAGGSLVAIKEYHEGDTIVPPECPEGFRWPDDMPTVMPAQNVTVRAEGLDDYGN